MWDSKGQTLCGAKVWLFKHTEVCRNAVCPWTWGQFPTKPTAPTWSKYVISRKTSHYCGECKSKGVKNLSYLGQTENTELWYLLGLCSAVCFPLFLFIFLWNFCYFSVPCNWGVGREALCLALPYLWSSAKRCNCIWSASPLQGESSSCQELWGFLLSYCAFPDAFDNTE